MSVVSRRAVTVLAMIVAIVAAMAWINADKADAGVYINPGNGHGGRVTAIYKSNTYELWEDCSVSITQNGHVVGGSYLQNMSESDPVVIPLKDTAADVMPWCVSN